MGASLKRPSSIYLWVIVYTVYTHYENIYSDSESPKQMDTHEYTPSGDVPCGTGV